MEVLKIQAVIFLICFSSNGLSGLVMSINISTSARRLAI